MPNPKSSVFAVIGRDSLIIKAGVRFGDQTFAEDAPVPLHVNANGEPGYIAGADYVVSVENGVVSVSPPLGIPEGETLLGGFHYAPGGNATARAGGDAIPAINPYSLWDLHFRPDCVDPRGMTFIAGADRPFWCDIYLTGVH